MTKNIRIRPASPHDVDAIAALLTELNHAEGQDVVTQPHAIAQALFADEREVHVNALVAVNDGAVIGTLLYYAGYDTFSASLGYHLADMVVHAEHRRLGMGKALLRELAAITLRENKSWVSLTALKHNDAARAFYRSLGMTQVDVDFFAMGTTALMQL